MSLASTPIYAGPDQVGLPCPVCHLLIEPHQLVQLHGNSVYHRRCWENQGPDPDPVPDPDPSPTRHLGKKPVIRDVTDASDDIAHVRASKILLLLLAVFIMVLGPMIAIVTGFVWLDAQNSPLKRRDGRELLICSVILFLTQLLLLALMIAGALEALRTGAWNSGTFTSLPR